MEISMKSAIGFKLVYAPSACTSSPSLAQQRRALHLPHASCTLAPCYRDVSTPLPVLVSA